ncbi:conserved hypothetical protein [Ricinus communis]|uniref:Uncharacterized protein n=1 Tax=Ricinus communis TaxID=3988 RepID=B9TBC5_RICCO|nr:conserved hypothetical protein [Ricinus communis]
MVCGRPLGAAFSSAYSASNAAHQSAACCSRQKMPPTSRASATLSCGRSGCVTTRLGTNSASASAVGFSFSSIFSTTWVGASARIFSRLTSLVPPTLAMPCTTSHG